MVTHGGEAAYELAKTASGSLTPIKVLLGRCLLVLEELEIHKNFGMSSVIHFAMSALGHSRKEALTAQRVAHFLSGGNICRWRLKGSSPPNNWPKTP